MKKVALINTEVEEKYKVKISYIKAQCPKCGNTWGINPQYGEVDTRQLVCERCITNEHLAQDN